jgi:AAHS family 3-hydroxyphenylpropionic acid transporter
LAVRESEIARPAAAPPASRAAITIALCCLAALCEGFDIQSMGVAAPTMAPALHLSRDQLGPVFSASTVGLFFGAFLLGRVADRIGRKPTLVASLALFGTFSLATAAAPNYPALLAIRVLAGLGLGGAMPNFIALVSETVSAAQRARFVAVASSAMPFGGAASGAVAAGLDWRTIFIVGGLAPLAVAAVMALALSESRQYLAARAARGASKTNFAAGLFGGGRAISTVLLWTGAFATLLTLYLLLNWLPTLMAAKGISKSHASLVSVLFNVGGGLGSLCIATLFGGRRRAPTFIVWFAGLTIGVALLATAGADLASAGGAGFVAGFFIASAPMTLFTLAPDFYDVEIRAAGVGGTVGAGRIGGILGPMLAGALLARGQDPSDVLLALLPFVALAAVAIFTLLGRRPSPP